ncbi:tryptophan halogenase domain-containing protein [Hirsutella rhossiliensis]|uniref:Tryptophan halogenase domain-containing protein n=1 Tax=Hirsutella rhossiliensis TaxID=111463 RepID=A0A9P8MM01_9HYPO|nr:tryptophan halogenase domain-containing protein [Hirsutella rhossiliensis]KAH0957442.1 tryptophan halogenase domain-containing protein [Hirsutella rhossiliensis]
MAVPQNCTVLVIGGGPAGSFAAACLAREGIETVLLEADKFPRYHIGESTLPSLRHFLKFIDFDDAFNAHGFYKKIGAAFRLNQSQPDAYTDFIAAGGPDGYAWNLVRSESDELLFRHAGACGAHILDETKVDTIQFEPGTDKPSPSSEESNEALNRGRPYLVDASGRHGILSTKYLRSRRFNRNFKNVANWAYWESDNVYGRGTHMEGAPYFEALADASGWCWFMPLHDGTRSVGIVQDQQMATDKKRELGHPSTLDFYRQSLELAPRTKKLLSGARLATDIKSASDWSYTSSSYHLPHARICGDAGCFIDPLFSSGVHLAITGGLSAAVTIAASLRGDCDEQTAGSWHSKKTVESYTRFFLAVSSATKQIRSQEEPVIQDVDEEGFQRAFDLLQPIIQGSVDADGTGKTTQSEMSRILEFCFRAFTYVPPEQKDALFEKLRALGLESGKGDATDVGGLEDVQKHLTAEEAQIVETLRSRRMIREDPFDMDSFTLDAIDGLAPRLERGKLGLARAARARLDRSHFYSPPFLDGRVPGIRESTRPIAL